MLLLIPIASAGQGNPKWNWEAAPMVGFLMPHHPDMLYLVDGHVWGGELNLTKRVDGTKDWHSYYLFPRWGFSFDAYDLGSEAMGGGLAGRIFFDLPTGKSHFFWLKLSIGAGWIERPFDQDDNIHNSAIGSHLNAALAIEGHVNFNLGENWVIKPGIGVHHFSNGAMTMPNSGINLAILKVAVMYKHTNPNLPTVDTTPFERKPMQLLAGFSGGMKEIKPIGGRKYAVINGFAILQKRISHKSSFGAELGVNYNESLQYRNSNGDNEEPDPADNYRPYFAALYQLHFDPLSLRFGLGSYFAADFNGDGNIFFRYHLLYQFERFQMFAGLKSHYARADNIELGMAFRLK